MRYCKVVLLLVYMSLAEGFNKALTQVKLSLRMPAAASDDEQDSGSYSLINLLNFAQETGSTGSSNKKFAESASRLRNQFLKTFAVKYDLTTGPLAGGLNIGAMDAIISGLRDINDDDALNPEAKSVRDVIMMQLNEINPTATGPQTILFYNEPMQSLSEFRYNPGFPKDCLDRVSCLNNDNARLKPLRSLSGVEDGTITETETEVVSSSDIMNNIRRTKSKSKQMKVEGIATVESPKRRKRDVFFGAIKSINPFNQNQNADEKEKAMSEEEKERKEEEEVAAQQSNLLDKVGLGLARTEKKERKSTSDRKGIVQAASINSVLERAKAQREAANPTLVAQQEEDVKALKNALRKEIQVWKQGDRDKLSSSSSSEVDVDTGADTAAATVTAEMVGNMGNMNMGIVSPRMEFPLQSEMPLRSPRAAGHANSSTYDRWKTTVEALEQAKTVFPNPRTLLYNGKGEFSSTHPNYAALLHSCMLCSMATYNLQLAEPSISGSSWFQDQSTLSNVNNINNENKDFNPWSPADWTSIGLENVLEGMDSKELRGVVDFLDGAVTGMQIDNMQPTLRRIRTAEVVLEQEMKANGNRINSNSNSKKKSEDNTGMDTDIDTATEHIHDKKDKKGKGKELPAAAALSEMKDLVKLAQKSIGQAQAERQALVEEGKQRARRLVEIAMVKQSQDEKYLNEKDEERDTEMKEVVTNFIQSDKAVCMVSTHENVTVVAFRGTKDPMDVLTDISFVSQTWDIQHKDTDGEGVTTTVKTHSGFLNAFEGLRAELTSTISSQTGGNSGAKGHKVVFTGHSMGGALAQLAAAHFSDISPHLITFSSPAVGNYKFIQHLEKHVQPEGGIRMWNEYDAVPYLALVVGFQLGGIPIKMRVSRSLRFKGPILYTGGVLCDVEWCIGRPLSSYLLPSHPTVALASHTTVILIYIYI